MSFCQSCADLQQALAKERETRVRALYDHRATLLDILEHAGCSLDGGGGRRRLKNIEQQIDIAEKAERAKGGAT